MPHHFAKSCVVGVGAAVAQAQKATRLGSPITADTSALEAYDRGGAEDRSGDGRENRQRARELEEGDEHRVRRAAHKGTPLVDCEELLTRR
eukprot:scaffold32475_cov27-Tisochrysis_lutea.AAC.3